MGYIICVILGGVIGILLICMMKVSGRCSRLEEQQRK
mgnify:CR=1 FL=1